ncbi:hypothetical protein oki416_05110 [Helicobacter pylori]
MTYRELGKKVLEQAERPLSVKEIFEKACEMGLDKECKDGKILPHSLGSQLGEHDISNDKKQFYVARKEGGAFFYFGSNLVKENFHHKKPQTPKMMNRSSVQAQPKNKKPLLMKGIYTHYL